MSAFSCVLLSCISRSLHNRGTLPTVHEPDISLPFSQEPATAPYNELDVSSPYIPTLFP
jgi:hypothetical protein